MRDKVTNKTVSTDHNFLRERRAEADSNRRLQTGQRDHLRGGELVYGLGSRSGLAVRRKTWGLSSAHADWLILSCQSRVSDGALCSSCVSSGCLPCRQCNRYSCAFMDLYVDRSMGAFRYSTIVSRGKIQGDRRKLLNRFKSCFGSQTSSQWLNEVHIYRLQPQSATKGELFWPFFLLLFFSNIFVFDCFESAHVALWHLT